jgi:hypothetical protein
MRQSLFFFTSVTLALFAAGVPSAHAQSSRLVVASGLDNPRGLSFGPGGFLYVVEAGRGGDSSLCLPQPDAPPTAPPRCYGPSGAITRVTGLGAHQRVVVGLPSLAGPDGAQATGPTDIAFGFGAAFVTTGLAADPAARAELEANGVRLGSLVRIDTTGQWADLLDLAAYEAAANPDGGLPDSNPYGLLLRANGGVFADAGGNSLINITPTGVMSTLAVFPTRSVPHPFAPGDVPMQSVPTSVVEGPDGSLFVGELTGFPFPVGGARVYVVPANGGTPAVIAEGFTNIIDIALADDGTGYVLEHDADGLLGPGTAGRLSRVSANGTVTVLTEANLTKPGGIAIGPDGALYITNMSTSAGAGEVVRLVP